jgi:hypothetical protein
VLRLSEAIEEVEEWSKELPGPSPAVAISTSTGPADADRRFDALFNFVHDPATLLVPFGRVAGNRGAPTRPALTA